MILFVSGDVEMNPDPFTDEQMTRMLETIELFPGMNKTQMAPLTEVTAIKQKQISVDEKLSSLSAALESLKKDVASLQTLEVEVQETRATSSDFTAQLSQLASSQDDLENRSRRQNLNFHGVDEEADETWGASETKIVQLCDSLFEIKLENSHVERAHRLGIGTTKRSAGLLL